MINNNKGKIVLGVILSFSLALIFLLATAAIAQTPPPSPSPEPTTTTTEPPTTTTTEPPTTTTTVPTTTTTTEPPTTTTTTTESTTTTTTPPLSDCLTFGIGPSCPPPCLNFGFACTTESECSAMGGNAGDFVTKSIFGCLEGGMGCCATSKEKVCHEGNTIEVSINSLPAQLDDRTGDYPGECVAQEQKKGTYGICIYTKCECTGFVKLPDGTETTSPGQLSTDFFNKPDGDIVRVCGKKGTLCSKGNKEKEPVCPPVPFKRKLPSALNPGDFRVCTCLNFNLCWHPDIGGEECNLP